MMTEEELLKRISKIPYPVSPEFNEDIIKEINNMEAEVIAPGVVVIHNAFDIDQEVLLSHIDSRAEEAHRSRWKWVTAEDGKEYGINEDGFRYRPEDVPHTPVRILDPVNPQTKEDIKNIFTTLEDQIYKALIK